MGNIGRDLQHRFSGLEWLELGIVPDGDAGYNGYKGAELDMRCTSCKTGQMEESETTYFAQFKNCYVIIENVPCMKCEQCGESVLKNSIAERIDDILDEYENMVNKISVIDYSKIA